MENKIKKTVYEEAKKRGLFVEQEGEEDVEKVTGEPKLYKLSDKAKYLYRPL